MDKEIWKPVVGFEELYEVSDLGRIRSMKRIRLVHDKNNRKYKKVFRSRVLKTYINYFGYEKIVLKKYKEPTVTKRVHRIVAEAFIPNPYSLPYINHIDCNKSNNTILNLEWVTSKQNYNHAKLNNLLKLGVDRSTSKISYDDILIIRKLLKDGNLSQMEVAKIYNVSQACISKIKLGQTYKGVK